MRVPGSPPILLASRLLCTTLVASFLGMAYGGCGQGSPYADYCTRMNECGEGIGAGSCVSKLEDDRDASAQIGCTKAHQMVTDCQERTGWCKESIWSNFHHFRWIEACSLEVEAFDECVARGTQMTCGNGVCDHFESCGTCPSDCGDCPCEGDGPC